MASFVRFAGAALGGIGFWQGFVHFLRDAHEQGVKLRELKDMEGNLIKTTYFSGSTNESISEELQTGDLVLFSRPCSMMRPCGSVACLGTKLTATASQIMPYDHCAVFILKRDGTPQLMEQTWSKGAQLRPYDLRIVRSLAETIVVRPLHFRRTKSMQRRAGEFVEGRLAEGDTGGEASSLQRFHHMLDRYRSGEFVSRDKGISDAIPINPSATLVARFYQDVLKILPTESSPGYRPAEDFLPADLLSCRFRQGATRLQEVNVRNR